jgi:glutamyl-Q tRNA(Asp) synthetase
MASYLDARAHHGRWLLRIEDIDEPRTVSGAAETMCDTLAALGMHADGKVIWQSQRKARYEAAFNQLGENVYPCGCSRKEIADSRVTLAADGAVIYPGTCRNGLAPGRTPRAWRVRVPAATDPHALIQFNDRWQGLISENLPEHVGDFVLKRADGFWAYQLAVVVDDAEQGVTDIVRGADLLESTPRQIYLQRLLGLSTPRSLHVPAVVNDRGEKLSKQTGAQPLDVGSPIKALMEAAVHLGLALSRAPSSVDEFWALAIPAWRQRFEKT